MSRNETVTVIRQLGERHKRKNKMSRKVNKVNGRNERHTSDKEIYNFTKLSSLGDDS